MTLPSQKADIGLIGLAVMGQNLVLNMEDHGFRVAVYNRTAATTDRFIGSLPTEKKIIGTHSIEELARVCVRPRKIMLMVKDGAAVDEVLTALVPFLEKGDIIIDGGNSHFKETIRRAESLKQKGLRFIGAGVSGGEEGARNGPSIMPGGDRSAWPEIKPIFQAIAAKVGTKGDIPCCEWIGKDGSGHYVKMVHNGIEYGDMQLICDAYFVIKEMLGLTSEELSEVFADWNKGDLSSYLIEITAEIFRVKDPETGNPLVEMIVDSAGQKGTGKWTSQNALDLGVPIPTMMEAVIARTMSSLKKERIEASRIFPRAGVRGLFDTARMIESVHDALYASKIMSYAQGFTLLKSASKEYRWNLNLGQIALMWRGGCIIRAQFLEEISKAFDQDSTLHNLILSPYFSEILKKIEKNWRAVVSLSASHGISVPGFSSSLSYFDAYRSERLPANLLQAQRDYFGAHTYERTDKEGIFHTQWK